MDFSGNINLSFRNVTNGSYDCFSVCPGPRGCNTSPEYPYRPSETVPCPLREVEKKLEALNREIESMKPLSFTEELGARDTSAPYLPIYPLLPEQPESCVICCKSYSLRKRLSLQGTVASRPFWENPESFVTLPCNHAVHKRCLRHYLTHEPSRQCPVCRLQDSWCTRRKLTHTCGHPLSESLTVPGKAIHRNALQHPCGDEHCKPEPLRFGFHYGPCATDDAWDSIQRNNMDPEDRWYEYHDEVEPEEQPTGDLRWYKQYHELEGREIQDINDIARSETSETPEGDDPEASEEVVTFSDTILSENSDQENGSQDEGEENGSVRIRGFVTVEHPEGDEVETFLQQFERAGHQIRRRFQLDW